MRFALLSLLVLTPSLFSHPPHQTLQRLQETLSPEQFTQVYIAYQNACLLIQTAPIKKQKELHLELMRTLTTHRSPHNHDQVIKQLTTQLIMPQAFATSPSTRSWHDNLAPPGAGRFELIWKFLGCISICGVIYLGITMLRDNKACNKMKTRDRRQHTKNKAHHDGTGYIARAMGTE